MTLRVAIVDDEPVAREYLRSLLSAHADISIVLESRNGTEAVRDIPEAAPELLFLDVRMPGRDGFQVLGELPPPLPVVVFVTAHDDYAALAFDVHALDYLLKPFDRARFEETLSRARRHFEQKDLAALSGRLQALLSSREGGRDRTYLDRLAVREKDERILIRTADIDWIGAESNYLRLQVGDRHYLIRYTMNSLERELDPSRFRRIHRSTIVNLDRIRTLSPLGHGDCAVGLVDGTELTMSRRYRDQLRDVLPEFG